jgi:chemotaxis protein histidine kinase CheA
MANAWIEHIKRFAREKGLSYSCALTDPECKATYKKPPRPLTQKKERESMGAEDASAKAIVAEEKARAEAKDTARKSAHKARTTSMKARVNKKQVEKQLVETMGMKGEDKDAPAEEKLTSNKKSKVSAEDTKKLRVLKKSMLPSKAPEPPSREPAQSDPVPPAKKKGGRPKKYATAEEAKEAKKQMTKESDNRRKEAKKTAKAPAPETAVQQVASAEDPLKKAQKEFDDFNTNHHEDFYNEVGQLIIPKKEYNRIMKEETHRLAEKYNLKKNWFSGKGLKGGSGATDFFNKIGNAFKSRFNDQGSPQERQATSVLLNKIEPVLIKPLQVLAPPIGDIADAQRQGLKAHYGLGLAKKRGRPRKAVGEGLKVGYSAEATGGLGHIYPISHDLILRMCEHLV